MNHCRKVIFLWIVMVVGLMLSCRKEVEEQEPNELSKKEEVVPKDLEKSKLPDSSDISLAPPPVFPREGPEIIRFDPENERSKIASKLGIEGVAILKVCVNREGRVGEVKIHRSSGYASLDTEAVRIAEDMRFKPALQRVKPVSKWTFIPVSFRIDTLQ